MSEGKEEAELASSLWRRFWSFFSPQRSSTENVQDMQRHPLDYFGLSSLSKTDHTVCFSFEPVLSWKLTVPIWVAVGCLCIKTGAQLKGVPVAQVLHRSRSARYRAHLMPPLAVNRPGGKTRRFLWNLVAIPSVAICSIAFVAAVVETKKQFDDLDSDSDDEDEEDENDAKTTTFPLDWRLHEEGFRKGKAVDVHHFRTGGCAWKVALQLRGRDQLGFYVVRDDPSFAQMPFTIEVVSKDLQKVFVRESFGDWGTMRVDGKGPVISLKKLQDHQWLQVTVTRDGSAKKPPRLLQKLMRMVEE